MRFSKAHAYGNDFLYVQAHAVDGIVLDRLATCLCERHSGAGADGLIVYEPTPEGASMRLFNADGGRAEVSGNGVRALGALLLHGEERVAANVTIRTDAGPKLLTRVDRVGSRQTFRGAMGLPTEVRQIPIAVAGQSLQVAVMNVGNPQCVLLGPLPDDERFRQLGAALEQHPFFPMGTNVEFAHVKSPDEVRIRIWERGVGPTSSSGTGSCAALVAAAAFGGAHRRANVVAPGGPQLVEWLEDSLYLTGWAEVLFDGEWLGDLPRDAGT
jgi:diaminopimelate epimerase